MNKHAVLLLDFDRVISNSRYFSEIYSEKYNIDINLMLPFFDLMRETVTIGQGDLKEMLAGVLETWKWKGNVDELMKFWFDVDCNIDPRFITLARKLQAKGVRVYLATDQEKYRAEYLWNNQGLKDWMDGKFVSCDLGYSKRDVSFFNKIVDILKLRPAEIVFFDDSMSKVQAAWQAGISAFQYTDFEKFLIQIKSMFNIV